MLQQVPKAELDERAREERSFLRRVYELAVRARRLDERLWTLYRQGATGFVLTGRGHEIAQIASAFALRPGYDYAWPYYRDICVSLTLGVTPFEMLLGAFGRADDPHSSGRQLPLHLADPLRRIGSVSSVIGAQVAHAVGAAYAARVRGEGWVSVCWFGDGASSEGITHEAMNLAALHRLAVVFICENNGWAIGVPLSEQVAGGSVAARAAAYAMPGRRLDGGDALGIFRATSEAVEAARAGAGPSLLELMVQRMVPHSSQDDDAYRTAEQKQQALAADPVPPLRARLLELGAIDAEEDARLWDEAAREMSAAAERARAYPLPPAERARLHLYALSDGQRAERAER